ncbi:MAG: ABC transporter permease [Myxococcota bacterium]
MQRATLRGPLAVLGAFVAIGVVLPLVAPEPGFALEESFLPPSPAHWLGTADNGVDVLGALARGARLAAFVALAVTGSCLALGAVLGTWAGYAGGRIDAGLSSLMDLLQAFPALVLQVALLALVERPTLGHLVLALVLPGWVIYGRLARAEARVLRARPFVEAARALGASTPRVLFRHVAPSLAGPLVVQATSGLGGVVLAEATLAFLGLGPGSSQGGGEGMFAGPSWGALLDQGTAVLLRFPHVALASGAAIAVTVLAFQLAGDVARDALDPRR